MTDREAIVAALAEHAARCDAIVAECSACAAHFGLEESEDMRT